MGFGFRAFGLGVSQALASLGIQVYDELQSEGWMDGTEVGTELNENQQGLRARPRTARESGMGRKEDVWMFQAVPKSM